MRAEDARKHARDLPDVTSEEVCGELARRANHARRGLREYWSQEPAHKPVIQCSRWMFALTRIPDSNPTSREVRKVPNTGSDPGLFYSLPSYVTSAAHWRSEPEFHFITVETQDVSFCFSTSPVWIATLVDH
jgi:hypothetical protein